MLAQGFGMRVTIDVAISVREHKLSMPACRRRHRRRARLKARAVMGADEVIHHLALRVR